MTWREVPTDSLLVIPVGSYEQHGPHLPLDTDTVIATALAGELATRRADVVLSPALAFGASGEHQGFPGTLSIGTAALEMVLIELIRSADHFRAVVIVNGHGGNLDALAGAQRTARAEGRRALAWSPRVPGGDAHAGRAETSLMAHLAPGTVRWEALEVGAVEPLDQLMARLRTGGVRAVSDNGVLGDPRGANAAEGRALFEQLSRQLTDAVAGWA